MVTYDGAPAWPSKTWGDDFVEGRMSYYGVIRRARKIGPNGPRDYIDEVAVLLNTDIGEGNWRLVGPTIRGRFRRRKDRRPSL